MYALCRSFQSQEFSALDARQFHNAFFCKHFCPLFQNLLLYNRSNHSWIHSSLSTANPVTLKTFHTYALTPKRIERPRPRQRLRALLALSRLMNRFFCPPPYPYLKFLVFVFQFSLVLLVFLW